MRRIAIALCAALAVALALAPGAAAKGMGSFPVPGGIALPGSPFRFQTFSPGQPGKLTVITRVNRDGGKAGRWWSLPGAWFVPGVTPGVATGLSADGSRLVLVRQPRIRRGHAGPQTDLAIVRPQVRTRRTIEGFPHWVDFVRLAGQWAPLAVSPDGATVFLRHHRRVRALDTASGRLLPGDPRALPGFDGFPFDQVGGRGGRWTYTLFGDPRGRVFVYALDSAAGLGRRIGLPRLRGLREPYAVHLELSDAGRSLELVRRWFPDGHARERTLASVDTASFAVRGPGPPRPFASIRALLGRGVGEY